MTITDRASALAALRAAGVPDGENYEIPGLVRLAQDIGAHRFLVERAGRWVVGDRERSLETVHGEYATEGEAARAFYDRVLAGREADQQTRPPRPDLPRLSRKQLQEEYERLRRDADSRNAERERRIAES